MTQSWKTLTAIQIGGALCLPVLAVGQMLGHTVGLSNAIAASVAGNVVLCTLGLLIGPYGARHKMSTIECAEQFLGGYATFLVASTVVLSCLGWFALQLGIMAQPFIEIFGSRGGLIATVFMGLLITASTLKGVAAVGFVADCAVPLFVLTLIASVVKAGPVHSITLPTLHTDSVLLVIALSLAAIVDLPTFFRFANSERDARISVVLLCLVGLPILHTTGAYIAINSGSADIFHALVGSGGVLWYGWIFIFCLLAGWTTNNANIYSASVSLRYIFPTLAEKYAIGMLGFLGTIIAGAVPLESFCTVIEIIALPIVPIGLLIAYAALREMISFLPAIEKRSALCVVLSPVIVGIVHTVFGITLTSYLLIDGVIAAGAIFLISLLIIQETLK
jgi:purine-cytosine permease-like protein